MHLIIAAIGILIAAAFWYQRASAAKDAAGDLIGAAKDVRAAARRFGFKNKSNIHPVDQIEDARLTAAGIAAAVAGMDGPLTQPEIDTMVTETRLILKASAEEATDIAAFGRWVAGQCGNNEEAVRRLTNKTHRITGGSVGSDLLTYVTNIAAAGGPINSVQQDALDRIRSIFGLD